MPGGLQDGLEKGVKKYPGLIGDYLVEFLGGLIPGILFIVALFFVFGPPLNMFMSSIAVDVKIFDFTNIIARTMELTKGTPYMIWFGTLVFGLVLSYVIGYLFYRRDPKEPNRQGFLRISKDHPTDGEIKETFNKLNDAHFSNIKRIDRWDKLKDEWKRRNYGCANVDECEFPFPFLHKYLKQRGHKHLLSLIRWKKEKNFRSKTFINSLKIRLQFYAPDKYQQIIRNEAHVRLTTSTWYMSKALIKFSQVGIIICVSSMLLLLFRTWFSSFEPFDDPFWIGFTNWLVSPVIPPLFIGILSYYCYWTNEKFIHYQRLREAFNVLELSYIAALDNPDFLNFDTIEKNRFFRIFSG